MVAATRVLRRDGAALLRHRDDKPGLRDARMRALPDGHTESGESMVAETDTECCDRGGQAGGFENGEFR